MSEKLKIDDMGVFRFIEKYILRRIEVHCKTGTVFQGKFATWSDSISDDDDDTAFCLDFDDVKFLNDDSAQWSSLSESDIDFFVPIDGENSPEETAALAL
jgi:hypothetical protein